MNRGFNYYFREGVKSSAKTLFKNKNYLKFFIYFFMELIGRLTIFLNPVFDMSNSRQGELVRTENDINISQSLRDSGRPLAIWTFILTVIIEALMILAGILIIMVITAVLGFIGYVIYLLTGVLSIEMMIGIFSIPGGILLAVYFVVMPLIFAPTAYIISANEGIRAGDVLSACFNTMKSEGKGTLFLSVFVPALIISAYLLVAGALYFVVAYLLGTSDLAPIIYVVLSIIVLVGFAIVAPIFVLASRSAVNHLFTDIIVGEPKTCHDVNIIRCNGVKVPNGGVEGALVSLFDNTGADEYAILNDIQRQAKNADASAFMPKINLNSAYQNIEGKKLKKQKGKSLGAEADEPLPTVSEILSDVEETAESNIPAPAQTDKVEPEVEQLINKAPLPTVEEIIAKAEEEAEQPVKEETPAKPVEEKPAPAKPAEDKPAEGAEKPADQPAPAQQVKQEAEQPVKEEAPAKPVEEKPAPAKPAEDKPAEVAEKPADQSAPAPVQSQQKTEQPAEEEDDLDGLDDDYDGLEDEYIEDEVPIEGEQSAVAEEHKKSAVSRLKERIKKASKSKGE